MLGVRPHLNVLCFRVKVLDYFRGRQVPRSTRSDWGVWQVMLRVMGSNVYTRCALDYNSCRTAIHAADEEGLLLANFERIEGISVEELERRPEREGNGPDWCLCEVRITTPDADLRLFCAVDLTLEKDAFAEAARAFFNTHRPA